MQATVGMTAPSRIVVSGRGMVRSGQMTGAVRQLTFQPAQAAAGPIELLTFADLRRSSDELLKRPQRPDFHVLALVRRGHGRHSVDFTDALLDTGTLVWIRPGQVTQWLDIAGVQGDLVLFTATAVAFATDTPSCWRLHGREWRLTLLAADHLRAEYDAEPAGPILPGLLVTLLRRSTATQASVPVPAGSPAQRFRALVEERLHDGHRLTVLDYAAVLGYSPRTLDRAVTAVTGVGAKTWLDQRTVLEAQRLLAHTDLSAASCGRRLGFHDPANFSAFFTHHVGRTPHRWRRQVRSGL